MTLIVFRISWSDRSQRSQWPEELLQVESRTSQMLGGTFLHIITTADVIIEEFAKQTDRSTPRPNEPHRYEAFIQGFIE
nr:hypothetical protein [Rubinisphaera brasiliensis]